MLSKSGMTAAWELHEPMVELEAGGAWWTQASSAAAGRRGRPSGLRAEGHGPGGQPDSRTAAFLASHP